MRQKSHTLYRFWNAADDLLYVGIAGDPCSRWLQHSQDKQWWREVDHITVSHFDSRLAVETAEVLAIRTEQPRHNAQHRPNLPAGLRVARASSGFPASEDEFLALVLSVAQAGAPIPTRDFTVHQDLAAGDHVVTVIIGPGKFVQTNSGGGVMKYPSVEIPVSAERALELRATG
jgi:hypothetical protein